MVSTGGWEKGNQKLKTRMSLTEVEGKSGDGPPPVNMKVEGNGTYLVNSAKNQRTEFQREIPRKHHQRMQRHAPDLLTTNINACMRKQPEKSMVCISDRLEQI